MIKESLEIKLLADYCAKWADATGVKPDVHFEDLIFRFLITNQVFEDLDLAVRYYFQDGRQSAEKLRSLLDGFGHLKVEGAEMLEFASGYGCVSRHLGNVLPEVHSVPCDIHMQTVEFFRQHLGMECILSATTPEDFDPGRLFDIIFCLSFYSHMPKRTFGRWLRRHYECLKPGGSFVFTTQGMKSAHYHGDPEIPGDGFWFKADSEQTDLDTEEYGQTIVTEEFVRRELMDVLGVEARKYEEGFWWNHQDLYVVCKD